MSMERQEAFVKHLGELGIKRSTIQRTINIGKAAISRAVKLESNAVKINARGNVRIKVFIDSVVNLSRGISFEGNIKLRKPQVKS